MTGKITHHAFLLIPFSAFCANLSCLDEDLKKPYGIENLAIHTQRSSQAQVWLHIVPVNMDIGPRSYTELSNNLGNFE